MYVHVNIAAVFLDLLKLSYQFSEFVLVAAQPETHAPFTAEAHSCYAQPQVLAQPGHERCWAPRSSLRDVRGADVGEGVVMQAQLP